LTRWQVPRSSTGSSGFPEIPYRGRLSLFIGDSRFIGMRLTAE
jgi:hypothetical protein